MLKDVILGAMPAHSPLGRAVRAARNTVAPWLYGQGGDYVCPVCGYRGAFVNDRPETGLRQHARCPHCQALERHRLQWVVLQPLLKAARRPHLLHVAPEACLEGPLRQASRYETADLVRPDVDHRADLTKLPFEDGSFEVVLASHVLEHVKDDALAIREIHRVLAPGGFAVLPVPVLGPKTIEYPAPNPHEAGHVRSPGVDYFDRYREVFARVVVFGSRDAPEAIQPWVMEDRSRWPETMPLRPRVAGSRHEDFVPVCWK